MKKKYNSKRWLIRGNWEGSPRSRPSMVAGTGDWKDIRTAVRCRSCLGLYQISSPIRTTLTTSQQRSPAEMMFSRVIQPSHLMVIGERPDPSLR